MATENQFPDDKYYALRQQNLAEMIRRVSAGERCIDTVIALEFCLKAVFEHVARTEEYPETSLASWLEMHNQTMRSILGLDNGAKNLSADAANSLPI